MLIFQSHCSHIYVSAVFIPSTLFKCDKNEESHQTCKCACIAAISCSSIAGGMNAIAAITLLDVVAPLLKRLKPEAQQDPKRALITFKLLGEYSQPGECHCL